MEVILMKMEMNMEVEMGIKNMFGMFMELFYNF